MSRSGVGAGLRLSLGLGAGRLLGARAGACLSGLLCAVALALHAGRRETHQNARGPQVPFVCRTPGGSSACRGDPHTAQGRASFVSGLLSVCISCMCAPRRSGQAARHGTGSRIRMAVAHARNPTAAVYHLCLVAAHEAGLHVGRTHVHLGRLGQLGEFEPTISERVRVSVWLEANLT